MSEKQGGADREEETERLHFHWAGPQGARPAIIWAHPPRKFFQGVGLGSLLLLSRAVSVALPPVCSLEGIWAFSVT